MWEEHPEYQKAQAKVIGIGVVLLFVAGIAYCISRRDWDSLRVVLILAGAIIVSLALLSGTTWLTVRILTRRRRSDTQLNHNHDAQP